MIAVLNIINMNFGNLFNTPCSLHSPTPPLPPPHLPSDSVCYDVQYNCTFQFWLNDSSYYILVPGHLQLIVKFVIVEKLWSIFIWLKPEKILPSIQRRYFRIWRERYVRLPLFFPISHDWHHCYAIGCGLMSSFTFSFNYSFYYIYLWVNSDPCMEQESETGTKNNNSSVFYS